MGTASYKNISMSCMMRLTQSHNELINSILQHGHVIRKNCFVLSAASWFLSVMLCPNLMVVQESTV